MTCVKCCTIVGDFCPIVSITEFFTVYNWHLVNCWLTTCFVNDCSNTRSYDNVYFFTFHYILLFLCEEFRNWRLMKWSRDCCVIFLSVRSTEAKDNSMKKNKQQQIRMFKSVCFHILMCFLCNLSNKIRDISCCFHFNQSITDVRRPKKNTVQPIKCRPFEADVRLTCCFIRHFTK